MPNLHLTQLRYGLLTLGLLVGCLLYAPCGWTQNTPPTQLVQTEFQTLSNLEAQLFTTRYEGEPIEQRLSRLEESVFGTSRPEQSPHDRLVQLQTVLKANGVEPNIAPNQAPDQPNNPNTPPQQPVAQKPVPGESDYPIVSVMEERVFGRPFEQEALDNRLGRLENRVFGHPTNGSLMSRVDGLRLAVLGVGPANTLPNPSNASPPYVPNIPSPANTNNPDTAAADDTGFDQLQNASPEMIRNTLDGLERKIYRTTYAAEPNPQRLDRLELTVFQTKAPPGVPDATRLQRLVAVADARGEEPQPFRIPSSSPWARSIPLILSLLLVFL